MDDLSAAGLNSTEAKTYKALLARKSWLPSELAQNVQETRTNMYKILDSLVAAGLAERLTEHKKLQYRATNPTRLLTLAHEQRTAREQAEKALELSAQELTREYVKNHEQAGVRYFQGKEGVRQIFADMLTAKTTIYLVRSPADVAFYDEAFFETFRKQRAARGIKTCALTPDLPTATHDPKVDAANLFLRTWLPADAYTGSVEWNVYDDKLAILSYGQEATGVILESPQIADSFRQLCKLLRRSHSSTPGK
jgi:sugar-specific transcriptional regulator TrmB